MCQVLANLAKGSEISGDGAGSSSGNQADSAEAKIKIDVMHAVPVNIGGLLLPWPLYSERVSVRTMLKRREN